MLGVRKFQDRLDRIDQKDIRDNDVQLLVDALVEILTEIVRFFPAGPRHCALSFGPLVFENGVAWYVRTTSYETVMFV